jgi:hypothetical protein
MNPGPTHPTLSGDQLDALERVYQSQLVSLILGQSNPVSAKGVLDKLTTQLVLHHRDPTRLITGSTKLAQGILGLRGE